jgi:hypothetical protein
LTVSVAALVVVEPNAFAALRIEDIGDRVRRRIGEAAGVMGGGSG